MNRTPPMTRHELATLEPGDQFVVYYAKDDDPNDVRCDYETRCVVANNDGVIDDGDYEWDTNNGTNIAHVIDTSRGHAYFYKTPEEALRDEELKQRAIEAEAALLTQMDTVERRLKSTAKNRSDLINEELEALILRITDLQEVLT